MVFVSCVCVGVGVFCVCKVLAMRCAFSGMAQNRDEKPHRVRVRSFSVACMAKFYLRYIHLTTNCIRLFLFVHFCLHFI